MTSVLASTTNSSANTVHSRSLWKSTSVVAALLAKFWWHTKAYSTSLGILVLIAGSMAFLHTHWFWRRFLLATMRSNQTKESSKLIRSQQP